jgi:hypothetical protein
LALKRRLQAVDSKRAYTFPELCARFGGADGNVVAPPASSPYVRTSISRLGEIGAMAHKVRLFNRHWHLPKSRPIRVGLGIVLIAGGLLGFLPVLGFWMLPLGLLVLSVDIPVVRRWRRQLTVWWHRRKPEATPAPGTSDPRQGSV